MTITPTTTAMTAAELNTALQTQDLLLIDVREPSEYTGGHIPGALLCPLAEVPSLQLPSGDIPIVLYCQSGRRSHLALQHLQGRGLTHLKELQGGLQAWQRAGYPLSGGSGAPISLMRQVQIVAGSLILTGVILGFAVNLGFFFLSGFVGAGLLFAGVTNTCALARLLALLPFNRPRVK